MPAAPLLDVSQLHIRFHANRRETHAVRGVSFALNPGATLALVGGSGSGKSATALALARLLPLAPQCLVSGQVRFDGRDVLTLPPRELRRLRGREIAYVFQEPTAALNPAYTVGFQIAEAIRQHFPDTPDIKARVIAALDEVGIRDAPRRVTSYPHELSGGMAQRVVIAMALACNPRLLVADEPTTALDVTVQRQILALIAEQRRKRDMAVLLITHNLGIVEGFANEVAVMSGGLIVEHGPTATVLAAPRHPDTQTLLAALPRSRLLAKRTDLS